MNKNKDIFTYLGHVFVYFFFGWAALAVTGHAEVVFDNSVGSATTPDVLTGHMIIPETRGTLEGANLYHSFDVFNVNTGESATFTGSAAIDNVISRITGERASNIDGPIISDTITGANLWLVNPNGIMFGANASLNIDGSFHASTADYIGFSDGGFVLADSGDTLLSMADPISFGFLDNSSAPLSMAQAHLSVPDGESLSFVGGSIVIKGGELEAPEGQINILSAASVGEAYIDGLFGIADNLEQFGDIWIYQNASLNVDESQDGGGAGNVFIRGGNFSLDNSEIVGNAFQREDLFDDFGTIGGFVSINVETLSLTDSSIDVGVFNGSADGIPGGIEIKAKSVSISGLDTTLFADADGSARGGNILIDATESISISGGAAIIADVDGSGDGGNVTLVANRIIMDGTNVSATSTGEESTGDAGSIFVIAYDSLRMRNGSKLETDSEGSFGGDITLVANRIVMDDATVSADSTGVGENGDAGSIVVVADDSLRMRNGSIIKTESADSSGGDITISTNNQVFLSDSEISTSARGNGGSVFIEEIDDAIDNPSFVLLTDSKVSADAEDGFGGLIFMRAENVLRGGSEVTARSATASDLDGDVIIDSANQDITSAIAVLDASFLDVSALLRERCSAAAERERSSFTVASKGGVPHAPNSYFPSATRDIQANSQVALTEREDGETTVQLSRIPRFLHREWAETLDCI